MNWKQISNTSWKSRSPKGYAIIAIIRSGQSFYESYALRSEHNVHPVHIGGLPTLTGAQSLCETHLSDLTRQQSQ